MSSETRSWVPATKSSAGTFICGTWAEKETRERVRPLRPEVTLAPISTLPTEPRSEKRSIRSTPTSPPSRKMRQRCVRIPAGGFETSGLTLLGVGSRVVRFSVEGSGAHGKCDPDR
eukprot:3533924-Rhodomonas_salina.1